MAGPLRATSGLGQAARLSYAALHAEGHEVYRLDLSDRLLQRPTLGPEWQNDAELPYGAGVILIHASGPLTPLALTGIDRDLLRGKTIIGCWAWELPRVPPEWREAVPYVHEIWATSRFTADALRPIREGRPLRVVTHPVAALALPAPREPRCAGPFTVFMAFNMASSFARKNPLAGIAAFKAAFGEAASARLVVKAMHLDDYPSAALSLRQAVQAPNIALVENDLSAEQLADLYAEADAVLSLHRSEGFGLVPAEGMLHGLPVIATDWSGSTDFLTPDCGCPVAYDLVPAHDPQGEYNHPNMMWAEARVADAARALRRLHDDLQFRSRLGLAARERAIELFSSRRYAKVVEESLGSNSQTESLARAL